jgi:hypothetical protein
MQNGKKSKKQSSAGAESPVHIATETMLAPQAHLIRIVDQEARRRAITALGKAREPYCGFTDFRLLVTDEHLDVLKREAITFEIVS